MSKLLSNSILDLAKCPNQKTCTFTFMHFPIGALPEVQNLFWNLFSHKVLYNYYSNFCLFEFFDLYLIKSKNGFPIVFQILRGRVQGVFFKLGSYFVLPNGLYLPTKQPRGVSEILILTSHIYIQLYLPPVLNPLRHSKHFPCLFYFLIICHQCANHSRTGH